MGSDLINSTPSLSEGAEGRRIGQVPSYFTGTTRARIHEGAKHR
jgi:hypothetical protein